MSEEKKMKPLKLKKLNKFGNEFLYPICPDAHIFSELLGTRTIPRNRLIHIRDLGYRIEIVGEDMEII